MAENPRHNHPINYTTGSKKMKTVYQLVTFNPDKWGPTVSDDVTCNPLFENLDRAKHAAREFEKANGGEYFTRTLVWVAEIGSNGLVAHKAEGAGETVYLVFESPLF